MPIALIIFVQSYVSPPAKRARVAPLESILKRSQSGSFGMDVLGEVDSSSDMVLDSIWEAGAVKAAVRRQGKKINDW